MDYEDLIRIFDIITNFQERIRNRTVESIFKSLLFEKASLK